MNTSPSWNVHGTYALCQSSGLDSNVNAHVSAAVPVAPNLSVGASAGTDEYCLEAQLSPVPGSPLNAGASLSVKSDPFTIRDVASGLSAWWSVTFGPHYVDENGQPLTPARARQSVSVKGF